jgi:hypothetical protein
VIRLVRKDKRHLVEPYLEQLNLLLAMASVRSQQVDSP